MTEGIQELPGRIEALLDDLAATGDHRVTEAAEQLVAAVVQLYGQGLSRLIDALAATPDGPALVRTLADDELLGNLMLLHGLHPDDAATRIQRALDQVRPYLGTHSGGIEYLGLDDDGIAHLRLAGNCDGCAGSTATVRTAVERAVLQAAPEVRAIDVEGMVAPPSSPLLQIQLRCPDGLAEAVGG
jgi:Fe-S cluster biogenesis protein NfuA